MVGIWYVLVFICKWTRPASFSFISFLWVGISYGRSNVWVGLVFAKGQLSYTSM